MICTTCRDCIYYLVTGSADEIHSESQQYHHTQPGTFLAAVQDGCYICYKYYVSVNPRNDLAPSAVWDGIKPLIFRGGRDIVESAYPKWLFRLLPENVSDQGFCSSPFEVYDVNDHDLACPYLASPRTDEPSTIALIKDWLQCCQDKHEACALTCSSYPSRLMDLCPEGLDGKFWRLVDTRIQPVVGDYVTLSHRWGNPRPTMLTLENQNALMRGSLLRDLSPVYQEAAHMAKALAVRYLWIDSLCVLQNQLDTQLEACKMADVYENGLCNFSALPANQSSMFVTRRADIWQPSARMLLSREIDGRNMIINDPDSMKDDIDKAPLSQRAWVFQEQILPRRTVFFGPNQIMWHCICSSASETHPLLSLPNEDSLHPWEHLNPPYYQSFRSSKMAAARRRSSVCSDLSSLSPRLRSTRSNSAASSQSSVTLDHNDHMMEEWRDFVEKYSRRQLNHFQDKPLGMAGTASRLAENGQRSYLCGLWEDSLDRDLLWQVVGKFGDTESAARRRQPSYIGPSWSWFSVDGGVLFRRDRLRDQETVARPSFYLREHHIESLFGLGNNFASIRLAWLHLKAPMLDMVYDSVEGFGLKVLRRDHRSLSLETRANGIFDDPPRVELPSASASKRLFISLDTDQKPGMYQSLPNEWDFRAIFLRSIISKATPPNMSAELQGLILTKRPPLGFDIDIPEHAKDNAYFRYCSFSVTFPLVSLQDKPAWMPEFWQLWNDELDEVIPKKPCFAPDADFAQDVFLF